MKLYTYDPAPNPRRLAMFLRYKGLELDTEQVDLMQGEQFSERFSQVNPLKTVPALVLDDGTVLTEVVGICTYLDNLYPEKPLLGSTPLEKGLVISAVHRLMLELMSPIADIMRNSNPAFSNRALPGPLDLPQLPQLAERGKLRLDHAWRSLDQALEGREWLAIDRPSLADIDLLANTRFVGWVKQSVPEDLPHLQAWLHRAKAEFATDSD